MINQSTAWDREYRKSIFLSKDATPQQSVKKFFRFLKKQEVALENATLLDIGCGTGRNSYFALSRGVDQVTGYDIAPTAIGYALEGVVDYRGRAMFEVRDITEPLPLADNSIDIVLDVTASQSLTTEERTRYLAELERVMKPNGWLFLRTLAKDGDDNAKWLVKNHPAGEEDMYIMPKTGFRERVFTRTDLYKVYSAFKPVVFKKTTGYNTMDTTTYKRNYFLSYMQRI